MPYDPPTRAVPPADPRFAAVALELLGIVCAITDAERRYVYASSAYERQVGEGIALDGERVEDHWPEHDAALVAPHDPAAQHTKHQLARRTSVVPDALLHGGAPVLPRTWELELTPCTLPSGAPATLSVLRDVAADVALGNAQKLELVGHLAAGVAHNFNNLLSVVLTNVEVALAAVPERSSLRGVLEDVRVAALRGEGLTRQLLAFGRRQAFEPRMVEVDEVVEAAVTLLSALVGEQVSVDLALGAPGAVVRGDEGQLEQVVVSLGVNARDAMPAGGRIRVATRVLSVDSTAGDAPASPRLPTGEYVEIAVSDTGIGMSAEVLARAFEPFFSTKPEEQGTGLGLPSARDIVTRHGGDIAAESAPGTGSSFRVFLPRAEQTVRPAKSARPAAPRGRKIVLLVEDEDLVRNATRRVLEISGFSVVAAANGAEALAVLEKPEQLVDLLLTDVVMPGMNGRELARRVHALRPNVPTVFISGYDAASAGVVDGGVAPEGVVLKKPVEPSMLIATLRAALGH